MTLDLFQNCDVAEEVSVTFDTTRDLNDDAVGRSSSLRAVLLFTVIRLKWSSEMHKNL